MERWVDTTTCYRGRGRWIRGFTECIELIAKEQEKGAKLEYRVWRLGP